MDSVFPEAVDPQEQPDTASRGSDARTTFVRPSKLTDMDFKSRSRAKKGPIGGLKKHHWFAMGAFAAATGVALSLAGGRDASAVRDQPTPDASASTEQAAVKARMELDLGLPVPPAPKSLAQTAPATPPAPPVKWETVQVKSGDSLAAIFHRAGLSPRDLHDALNVNDDARKALTRIFPGEEIHYRTGDHGELAALRYRLDESQVLTIERGGKGFEANVQHTPIENRLTHAAAVIDSSLYLAGRDAGLNERLIMELAGIFGWDVDFALDIRAGDRFIVIYEERFRDGEKIGEGDIVAAEFVNQGRVFRAVRYTRPDGETEYYSPDGRSMRKEFLRTPVDFRRISSRFTKNRCHPILGVCRPHEGVDYAAPTGTPIRASGDGKIIWRSRKGGYGRTIVIKHGAKYSTLYAHMSRYAGGLHVGSPVRQGQTIGYVGMSGLATGPHLHYEFRINGVHHNPLTVHLPDARPIADKYKADFLAKTGSLVSQLDVLNRRQTVAANEQSN